MAVVTQRVGIGRISATDLREKLYYFGKLDANNQVVLAGAGDIGFPIEEKANVGQQTTIALTAGAGKVALGATVAAMTFVKPGADGRAVAAAAGDAYSGLLLEGGDAGTIVEMLLVQGNAAA